MVLMLIMSLEYASMRDSEGERTLGLVKSLNPVMAVCLRKEQSGDLQEISSCDKLQDCLGELYRDKKHQACDDIG